MNKVEKSMPEILRELRASKKATQSDIAKLLGLTTNAYQSYERGTSEPGCRALNILADFYGVTTDYLLGREPAPNPFADLGLDEDSEKNMLNEYMSFPPPVRAMLMDALIQLAGAAKEQPEGEELPESTMEDCGTVGEELERRAREAELEAEALGKETA